MELVSIFSSMVISVQYEYIYEKEAKKATCFKARFFQLVVRRETLVGFILTQSTDDDLERSKEFQKKKLYNQMN